MKGVGGRGFNVPENEMYDKLGHGAPVRLLDETSTGLQSMSARVGAKPACGVSGRGGFRNLWSVEQDGEPPGGNV